MHAGAATANPAPAVERSHTIEMLAQSSKANLETQPSFELFAPIDLRTPAKSNRGKGQGTPAPGQPTPTETDSPARSLLMSPVPGPAKTSPTKTSPTKTSPAGVKKGFVPASSLQRSRTAKSLASQQPKTQGYWKCRCCIDIVCA